VANAPNLFIPLESERPFNTQQNMEHCRFACFNLYSGLKAPLEKYKKRSKMKLFPATGRGGVKVEMLIIPNKYTHFIDSLNFQIINSDTIS
jgi:hypothetical protein